MYQYWGFGLNIASEVEMPELLPASFTKADIHLRQGEIPIELTGPDVIKKVRFSITPNEYLLTIPNICRYYVHNGAEIVISPFADADVESVRLFILSNCFAAILHQRRCIPFHASGVLVNGKAVLFTGRSGAGKSTALRGLQQRGYRAFTDDVCVLHPDPTTGKIMAVASYPMIKLWKNTADHFQHEDLSLAMKLRPNLPKYGFINREWFTTEMWEVSSIYLLNSNNLQTTFSVKVFDKVSAFNLLQLNTYRRKHIDMMKMHGLHFQIISRLTAQVTTKELLRPAANDDIDGFIDFIVQNL